MKKKFITLGLLSVQYSGSSSMVLFTFFSVPYTVYASNMEAAKLLAMLIIKFEQCSFITF